MKSYLSEQRIHLVGKAWEVRRFLQVLQKDGAGREQPLAEYLNKFSRTGRTKPSSKAGRSTLKSTAR